MEVLHRVSLVVLTILFSTITFSPRAASAQNCDPAERDPLGHLTRHPVLVNGQWVFPGNPAPWAGMSFCNPRFAEAMEAYEEDGGPAAAFVNGPFTIATRDGVDHEDVVNSVGMIAFVAAEGPESYREYAINALFQIGAGFGLEAYGRRAAAHHALMWLAEHGDLPDEVSQSIISRLAIARNLSPLNPPGLPTAMLALPGIRVEDGVVVAEGPIGRATLEALRADGGVEVGGVFEENGFNLSVTGNGQLVVVGANGETHPLEILGVNTQADGTAAVLVRATGSAGVIIGNDSQTQIGFNANLFAGAEAQGSASITVPLFLFDITLSAGGQAQFGVGGTAEAQLSWGEGRNGRWALRGETGLSLAVGPGLGGEVGFSLSPGAAFDPPSNDPLPPPVFYDTLDGSPRH